MEQQVLADRQRPVQVVALGHDRNQPPGPHRVGGHIHPTQATPPVGRTLVVRTPTVVVFPAPFGPSSPNTSPGVTANDTPSTAFTRPFG
jgi:hypothetical protein